MERGSQRIAYQTKDLQPGKVVTVKIINPNFKETEHIMNDAGNGIYYLDLNFITTGSIFYRVWEDGDFIGSQRDRVETTHTVVPYRTELEGI